MTMLNVGRPTRPEGAAESAGHASLTGGRGLLQDEPQHFLQTGAQLDASAIEAHIAARAQAKASRNWAEADRIRDQLLQQGIVLKDSPTGTTWEMAQ
mgnify:CR=1 FL=1